jgi:hypothetical protein
MGFAALYPSYDCYDCCVRWAERSETHQQRSNTGRRMTRSISISGVSLDLEELCNGPPRLWELHAEAARASVAAAE